MNANKICRKYNTWPTAHEWHFKWWQQIFIETSEPVFMQTLFCIVWEALFTHHIHYLHEAEAEVDSEALRVIEDWSLQRVVVSHQVSVQPALVFPLKRNLRRQRKLETKYIFIIASGKMSNTDIVANFFTVILLHDVFESKQYCRLYFTWNFHCMKWFISKSRDSDWEMMLYHLRRMSQGCSFCDWLFSIFITVLNLWDQLKWPSQKVQCIAETTVSPPEHVDKAKQHNLIVHYSIT